MKHEAAEAASDVDHRFAGFQEQLATHVLDLVGLRFFERPRAVAPIRARVHHQRIVEPELVEIGAKPVVLARIELGALTRGVRAPELVPAIRLLDECVGRAEAAAHAGAQCGAKITVDVDISVEVRVEQSDVTERDALQLSRAGPEPQRKARRPGAITIDGAVRKSNLKDVRRRRTDRFEVLAKKRSHVRGSFDEMKGPLFESHAFYRLRREIRVCRSRCASTVRRFLRGDRDGHRCAHR